MRGHATAEHLQHLQHLPQPATPFLIWQVRREHAAADLPTSRALRDFVNFCSFYRRADGAAAEATDAVRAIHHRIHNG